MPRRTKEQIAFDKRLTALNQSATFGFSINMHDLSKVSARTREEIAKGGDDATVLAAVRAYIEAELHVKK